LLEGPPVALPHAPLLSKRCSLGLKCCFGLHDMIHYECSRLDLACTACLGGVNGGVAGQRERCCTRCLLRPYCKSCAVLALCLCLHSYLGCISTCCYGRCIQTADPATSSNILCLSVHGAIAGSRHVYMSTNKGATLGVRLPSAAIGTVSSTLEPRQLLLDSYCACAAAGLATAADLRTGSDSKAIQFLSSADCRPRFHGHTSGNRRRHSA
jgi:hypothetical protein